MARHQLTQLTQEATRVKEVTATLLGHIYVTNPEHVRSTKVGLSDHFPVCFVQKLNWRNQNHTKHMTIKYRSYKTSMLSSSLKIYKTSDGRHELNMVKTLMVHQISDTAYSWK